MLLVPIHAAKLNFYENRPNLGLTYGFQQESRQKKICDFRRSMYVEDMSLYKCLAH